MRSAVRRGGGALPPHYNLTDPTSRIAQLAHDERGYRVLDGLNTKPAVTYLMKVRNVAEA